MLNTGGSKNTFATASALQVLSLTGKKAQDQNHGQWEVGQGKLAHCTQLIQNIPCEPSNNLHANSGILMLAAELGALYL